MFSDLEKTIIDIVVNSESFSDGILAECVSVDVLAEYQTSQAQLIGELSSQVEKLTQQISLLHRRIDGRKTEISILQTYIDSSLRELQQEKVIVRPWWQLWM